METQEWDAVVIGGGVAGLSAAQMLGRARRRTLVVDAGQPRNRFAAHMHGVLGHDGVDPQELLARGRSEVRAYGVEIVTGEVTAVEDRGEVLTVRRGDGTIDAARTIVVTSGIRDELPDIPGLAAQWGRGVLHCPYCHGWEVAGRRLGVLATSPASVHQIELVRQWSDAVTAFTALAGELAPEVAERLAARGIRVVEAPVTELIVQADALVGVRTADGAEHDVDALFTASAPRIHDAFLADLALDRTDGVITVDLRGGTSHPRVFAAGNVVSPFGKGRDRLPRPPGPGRRGGGGGPPRAATPSARSVTPLSRASGRGGSTPHSPMSRAHCRRARRWRSGRVRAPTPCGWRSRAGR